MSTDYYEFTLEEELSQEYGLTDDLEDSFQSWMGLRGPTGDTGEPGTTTLKGPVASTAGLPASAPADELWIVGAASPYDAYFWNGTQWVSLGQVAVSQGPQGDPGPTGPAAGFGTPTATVGSGTGTPTVTVTASGPDTAKVFSFAFDNLKGDPGIGAVSSVNGQTGAVVLDADDVGALPDSYTAPVDSVNSKTGAVTLTASDVGALPDTYTAPVSSVNGKTGAVVLSASDVGAMASGYTPPPQNLWQAVSCSSADWSFSSIGHYWSCTKTLSFPNAGVDLSTANIVPMLNLFKSDWDTLSAIYTSDFYGLEVITGTQTSTSVSVTIKVYTSDASNDPGSVSFNVVLLLAYME